MFFQTIKPHSPPILPSCKFRILGFTSPYDYSPYKKTYPPRPTQNTPTPQSQLYILTHERAGQRARPGALLLELVLGDHGLPDVPAAPLGGRPRRRLDPAAAAVLQQQIRALALGHRGLAQARGPLMLGAQRLLRPLGAERAVERGLQVEAGRTLDGGAAETVQREQPVLRDEEPLGLAQRLLVQ